ncbi:MAG TPA: aldo/keto reductase [Gaiellaceae bacterium]|jgi:aryl-alcohol dehydrogenase-like predicted oxidoreductase
MTEMRYVLFGRSGLRVSELCLGTMTFGTDWGWGADAETCRAIFQRFAEAGGNFVDTSNNYTDGSSERIVGELVAADRDRWVVATKYTLTSDRSDPNAGGNHRKSLVRSLESSLRRLGTDHVDLLWLHMHDATTPIDEAVRALDDQVRAGKVLYVGISDSPAWVVARANTLAELRGWSPFVGLQLPYSLAGRDPERELLPMAGAFGLTVTAWGVLEAGVLTGKPAEQRRWPEEAVSERVTGVVEAVQEVAAGRGCTPSQVAIAWLRARPSPPTIVPILGARTEAQIVDNLGALAVDLEPAELGLLDAAGRPALGFPRSFLESSDVRGLIYGDTWERLVTAAGP